MAERQSLFSFLRRWVQSIVFWARLYPYFRRIIGTRRYLARVIDTERRLSRFRKEFGW
jgi:hypothetical protein